ncbi:unnamed protein product [Adineta steineri]|uniref:B box-type domain-containing protein n=1 Tax=Adineta steineri TaxID=433720 RepID=A0A814USB6_9BILA|nr:unnamed protein product [Adineta steineri]CAF1239659.1 unnamed protein product [Adineta steineri]CAF1240612.1 unnamed protein product [Adineta steineri]
MAVTGNSGAKCSICNKANATCLCSGCSKDFCFQHLIEHRQILDKQLEEAINDHNQFQQTIIQQKQNPLNSSLIKQINQWETTSIHQIQQRIKECREKLMNLTQKSMNDVEKKFIELSKKLKEIREENEFNEVNLKGFQLKLTEITQEFLKSSNISIREDSKEFINKISVISSNKWKQQGILVAGGNGKEDHLNQLYGPEGIFIDHHNNIFIAEWGNHRIVEWKCRFNNGQIIAGGNVRINRNDQLSYPTDVLIDKQNDSFIISDSSNRRVIRCFRQNSKK